MDKTYAALVVRETADQEFTANLENLSIDDLPEDEVLIQVWYSSVNYKDYLSSVGNRGVTKTYPHTPGIDAAGIVVESSSPDFSFGDRVLVTGFDLGMNTPGGFGQYIRVPGTWVVRLPGDMTLKQSMIWGTAGFTAAMSIHYLLTHDISSDKGPVLVSGATGSVGCLAVALLARMGFQVAAVNGRTDRSDFLKSLGAESVVEIDDVVDDGKRPLLKSRWAAAVDTVGGQMLGATLRSLDGYGVATCCGNVGSHELPLNVYPFIIRGITLVGVDSQNCPMALRQEIWGKLAEKWKIDELDRLVHEVTLQDLPETLGNWRKNRHLGRTVVNLGAEG